MNAGDGRGWGSVRWHLTSTSPSVKHSVPRVPSRLAPSHLHTDGDLSFFLTLSSERCWEQGGPPEEHSLTENALGMRLSGSSCQSSAPSPPRHPAGPITAALRLTLIAELKAYVWVTLVGGEEEVEVVAGADEELGDLGAMVNPNQGCWVRPSISHFQGVVVDLGFKSAEDGDEDFLRNPRISNLQMTRGPAWPRASEQLGFGRLGYLNIICTCSLEVREHPPYGAEPSSSFSCGWTQLPPTSLRPGWWPVFRARGTELCLMGVRMFQARG